MQIERYNSDRFFGQVNGIKIDNSYDIYTLNQYKKLIKENNIDYIVSQDYDLSYLVNFQDIKYLSVSDVDDIKYLYLLKNLVGLRINSKYLNDIDISYFKSLRYLYIIEDKYNKLKDYKNISYIENLCIEQFDITDLRCLSSFKVKNLHIIFCGKLNSLIGIETLEDIESLHLEYCIKLSDISSLGLLSKSLINLSIVDSCKIKNIEVIHELHNLRSLILINDELIGGMQLKSIDFLDKFKHLQTFKTSYRILDGNLKPLLRLTDASILKFFRNYNLKDKELPHEYVIIDNEKFHGIVSVDSLEDGINNKYITWLDKK